MTEQDMATLAALGIDTDEGLAYCADDPEFYEEMLAAFVDEAATRTGELGQGVAAHDWARYGICAHSIKSTARMIGAEDVSERARVMELAAKEGRAEDVTAGHEAFLAAYTRLVDGIQSALGAAGA